ncbi:MAG TPA: adenylyltransferase/cytidyltransferase family protein [Saprospiraceae bacterium]|nr:adenylyltransferase/cytidyltransferase family protein [Saprospiraceae bacterium]HPI06109.1 adenylyltransferase/cytidyltransferase family protein [Saprospiraceae bacterium]
MKNFVADFVAEKYRKKKMLDKEPSQINEMRPKVMVTGCFDLLHSGHVAFLQEAAQLGDLYVCIGSDENVCHLKGRYPVNSQDERRFMLAALSCVREVTVNAGVGIMDFLSELDVIRPDIFFVNEDGHTPSKETLCQEKGIQYIVSRREPAGDLPARSTTALRVECTIPFRIDLAGGWLDQPWVSCHYPGPVLTVSIEPNYDFNFRSGMATSTRKKAIELWRTALPTGDPEQLARMLFAYENPPGTKEVAGSQDSIGIVFPGLNRSHFNGSYWPERIESVHDEAIMQWLEQHLFLVTLGPRTLEYDVLADTHIDAEGARALADAAEGCWEAALRMDTQAFGTHFRRSFEAQIAMFPNMVDDGIFHMIDQYRDQALGWKLSGAGGGGYLVLWAEKPVEKALQVKVRRRALQL